MRWLLRTALTTFLIGFALPSPARKLGLLQHQCIRLAAHHYYQRSDPVPFEGFVDLIEAVLAVEGGCGRVASNNNGSRDIGCMQINSVHLPLLASYGISEQALYRNDCQNIMVGVWILHSGLQSAPNLWVGVGNYNSHTPSHNTRYQQLVWLRLQRLWANRMAVR
jgi:hypothetical protein